MSPKTAEMRSTAGGVLKLSHFVARLAGMDRFYLHLYIQSHKSVPSLSIKSGRVFLEQSLTL